MLHVKGKKVMDGKTLLATWDDEQEATDWAGWLDAVEYHRAIRQTMYRLPKPWLTEAGIARVTKLLQELGYRPLKGGFPENQWWTDDPSRLDANHHIEVVMDDGTRKKYRNFWGEALWVIFEQTRFYHCYLTLFTWERLDDGSWVCVEWLKGKRERSSVWLLASVKHYDTLHGNVLKEVESYG